MSSASGLPTRFKVPAAERRLRIAVVYGRMPLPMTRADQMTVAHFIAYLSARGHRVDLFALDTGEPLSSTQQDWLADRCGRVDVVRQRPWQSVLGALAALVRGRPLQVGWFTNRRQTRRLREAIAADGYDIVYTYYLRSAEAVRGIATAGRPQAEGMPATFLALQLSQSLNARRIAEHSTRLRDKLVYGVEWRLLRRYEARIWRAFRRTVLIGKCDLEEVAAACRERGEPVIDNHLVCAHGVDIERFRPRPELVEPATVVFSGVMRTNTNIEAIGWFVRNCWARVKEQVPDARLLIVGRSPPPQVQAFAQKYPDITVTGEVPDLADYIARAAVCINPMQAGAGMQNKLIEYLASAKPVVATPVANEGVQAKAGEHLLIAATPEEFSAAVVRLLEEPQSGAALGAAGRRFIESTWTWEKLFAELETAFLAEAGVG